MSNESVNIIAAICAVVGAMSVLGGGVWVIATAVQMVKDVKSAVKEIRETVTTVCAEMNRLGVRLSVVESQLDDSFCVKK